MEREQIVKALECCGSVDADISTCDRCPFEPKEEGKGLLGCNDELIRNTLALIKELIEENENLTINRNAFALAVKSLSDEVERLKQTKAATVRKMQERLKSLLVVDLMSITKEQAFFCIDRIADEMMEGEK